MAKVGYLEGVDPLVLTRLALRGIGTLPVSNGFDNHGKFLNSISERDEVVLVVGHLHKLLGPRLQIIFLADILGACRQCSIPVLILVPEADHPIAREALAKAGEVVRLVDPARLWDELARELELE